MATMSTDPDSQEISFEQLEHAAAHDKLTAHDMLSLHDEGKHVVRNEQQLPVDEQLQSTAANNSNGQPLRYTRKPSAARQRSTGITSSQPHRQFLTDEQIARHWIWRLLAFIVYPINQYLHALE